MQRWALTSWMLILLALARAWPPRLLKLSKMLVPVTLVRGHVVCVHPRLRPTVSLCLTWFWLTISRLGASRAVGVDGVPMFAIRSCLSTIAPHILHLINSSISSLPFPDAWKVAVITPIHKSGDPSKPSNFLPISILSALLQNPREGGVLTIKFLPDQWLATTSALPLNTPTDHPTPLRMLWSILSDGRLGRWMPVTSRHWHQSTLARHSIVSTTSSS